MGTGRPDQQVYLIVERVNQQTEGRMRLVIRIAVRKTAPFPFCSTRSAIIAPADAAFGPGRPLNFFGKQ